MESVVKSLFWLLILAICVISLFFLVSLVRNLSFDLSNYLLLRSLYSLFFSVFYFIGICCSLYYIFLLLDIGVFCLSFSRFVALKSQRIIMNRSSCPLCHFMLCIFWKFFVTWIHMYDYIFIMSWLFHHYIMSPFMPCNFFALLPTLFDISIAPPAFFWLVLNGI